jgi:hypothetical protein
VTIRPHYDVIVLGATVPGVLFAAAQSRSGKSVLLTNQYGFPGGNITEVLNCVQDPPSSSDAILMELYRNISAENVAPAVVNPETVKYALQQLLESTTVDLYYHVVPKSITIEHPASVAVALLAKEGITTIHGTQVIDASDELYGAEILGLPLSYGERTVNLFVAAPKDQSFLSFRSIRRAIELNDGRYWISLTIASQDELFREDETHMLLDEFRIVLERSGSRIQMLPLGISTRVTIKGGNALNGSFMTVFDLQRGEFTASEQFLRAASMLEHLNI